MAQSAVRVRLEVNDGEAAVLLRASGARRFAFNWTMAKIRTAVGELASAPLVERVFGRRLDVASEAQARVAQISFESAAASAR